MNSKQLTAGLTDQPAYSCSALMMECLQPSTAIVTGISWEAEAQQHYYCRTNSDGSPTAPFVFNRIGQCI